MNRKRLSVYITAGVAFLVAVWISVGRGADEQSALFVDTMQGDFQVIVSTTGELQAQNSTQIRGPQGAREIQLYQLTIQNLIPEGSVVEKGDFVAELDRSELMTRLQDAQLALQRVESQFEQAQLDSSLTLTQARNTLENLHFQLEEHEIAVEQTAYESPSVQRQAVIELERTRRELEQEKIDYVTRVRQAEAQLREIEADLTQERNKLERLNNLMGEFTIHAPENGMIVYARNWQGRKTTTGSTISAFDPVVAELPDLSSMESRTYVNEVDIQKVRPHQKVTLELDAVRGKQLTGEVTRIANIGEQRPNSSSRVFEVIITINEADTTLRPAMTTSNDIVIETVPEALFIPLEAVHTYDSRHFTFKRVGGQTVMQEIVMGSTNDNDVVILEGLQPDDQVLISAAPDISGLRRNLLQEEVTERSEPSEPDSEMRL